MLSIPSLLRKKKQRDQPQTADEKQRSSNRVFIVLFIVLSFLYLAVFSIVAFSVEPGCHKGPTYPFPEAQGQIGRAHV